MNVHVLAGLVIGILVFVAALSVIPVPSVAGCNVAVEVSVTEVSYIIGTYYAINGVNPSVTGPATILDWGAWLSTSPPALLGSFSMTATVGGHTSTKTGTQILPSVPIINGAKLTATDTFNLGQVPQGEQGVSVVLVQNGQTVATGQSSLNVGC